MIPLLGLTLSSISVAAIVCARELQKLREATESQAREVARLASAIEAADTRALAEGMQFLGDRIHAYIQEEYHTVKP